MEKLTPSSYIGHTRRKTACPIYLVRRNENKYNVATPMMNDRDGNLLHEEEHRILDQNKVTDRDPLSGQSDKPHNTLRQFNLLTRFCPIFHFERQS